MVLQRGAQTLKGKGESGPKPSGGYSLKETDRNSGRQKSDSTLGEKKGAGSHNILTGVISHEKRPIVPGHEEGKGSGGTVLHRGKEISLLSSIKNLQVQEKGIN